VAKVYLVEDLIQGSGILKIRDVLGFVVENTGTTPINFGFTEYSQNIGLDPQGSRTFEVSGENRYDIDLHYSAGINGLLVIQTKPLTVETII
jgi:hypothetical protein